LVLVALSLQHFYSPAHFEHLLENFLIFCSRRIGLRRRLIAALTPGELERAWERDVGGPCRARIYHCVREKSKMALAGEAAGEVGVYFKGLDFKNPTRILLKAGAVIARAFTRCGCGG
jgi:hypothetical protein